MLIQEQLPWTHIDDEHLSIFKAIGVDYVTINAPPPDLKDGVDRGRLLEGDESASRFPRDEVG